MEQERDFFTLLLMEGSTGAERENFLGVEGRKEFAPEVIEHIQVWLDDVRSPDSRDDGSIDWLRISEHAVSFGAVYLRRLL